jgi:tripartite-type tricarboxylate transporter receptor subunit TctC
VPCKGINLAINDTIGGRVQTLISDQSGVQRFIRSGALKALPVTSLRRIPLLPNVPTMAEAGLPKVLSNNLTGRMVPAATPANAEQRLHDAVMMSLKKPDVVELLSNQGVIPTPASAGKFEALLREKRVRWARIIKAHGIRADG